MACFYDGRGVKAQAEPCKTTLGLVSELTHSCLPYSIGKSHEEALGVFMELQNYMAKGAYPGWGEVLGSLGVPLDSRTSTTKVTRWM